MTPAELCQLLMADPKRYDIPTADQTWERALGYFCGRFHSSAEFERLLTRRSQTNDVGARVAWGLLSRWRHFRTWPAYEARSLEYLRLMLGPDASFREGQWEAIHALVEKRARVLVVQKTGWGKSLVYFIATRILRDQGAGPTLLISPLLSLMRNQIEMAQRIGVRALSINSTNPEEWAAIDTSLREDAPDVLLVSPERLANAAFQTATLPRIQAGIGLLVVDEAHCISDWGHDFRPDYRRIVRLVRGLPRGVPVLATTATANDRVVKDIVEQVGPELTVLRGPLSRPSLRLQTVRLADQAERLAWLAEHLPTLAGSGIIYCLTVADCERVSAWLLEHGIDAPAYFADLDTPLKETLEQRLQSNDVKALVATVALGMGYDKPDLGFVVHFQRPGSVVAYYQQIGRAGRAVDEAFAVLLNGREDDDIQEYFIQSAFPAAATMRAVLVALEGSNGLPLPRLERQVNVSHSRLQQSLKVLEIEGAVARDGTLYRRTVNRWQPDEARSEQVTALRYRERERMDAFMRSDSCLMEFVARELDDPTARPCGRCAVCAGDAVPRSVDPRLVEQAVIFLRRSDQPISPRLQWPAGAIPDRTGSIPLHLRNAPGRVLSIFGDAGWGEEVRRGKYHLGRFSDELVEASAELIRRRWAPQPPPTWVTAIPSMRSGVVVDFARRLAHRLALPYQESLRKTRETPAQKTMQNSAQQAANVAGAFEVIGEHVRGGPVLLVDDMVDSRWTLTVCGTLLREAGSELVYPFTLASTAGARGRT